MHDSSIERTISGTWWRTQKPDERFLGTLTLYKTGRAVVELKQAATRTDIEVLQDHFSGPQAVSVQIHGLDEHGHPVSLLNCIRTEHQMAAALTVYAFAVNTVLLGLHCTSLSGFRFDELQLDLENLQEWLCTPFPKTTVRGKTICLKPPLSGERVFPTDSGFSFTLRPWLKQDSSLAHGHTFSFVQLLSLRFSTTTDFDAAHKIILDLQWLMTLAMKGPAKILKIVGWLKPGEGERLVAVSVHRYWPGSSARPSRMHRDEMLFTAESAKRRLGKLFDLWRTFRSKNEPVLSCYFSTEFNEHLYANHRFLFLAHALELYHRFTFSGNYESKKSFTRKLDRIEKAVERRHPRDAKWVRERLSGANRKTFSTGIKELLEKRQAILGKIVSAAEIDEFAKNVKDTRNYYTHYDESLKATGRVAEGESLWKLEERIRAILEVCILYDLELPNAISKAGRFRTNFVKPAE